MLEARDRRKRLARWYFGGLSSACAACCTHPLDLLKVHLQMQPKKELNLLGMGARIVQEDGVLGLYNGLSASLLRQLTYSTARYGMYEMIKQRMTTVGNSPLPFYQKILIASVAGACGGFIGTPGDVVNVRMQNDMRLPKVQRRNYRNVFDGLARVIREEGLLKIFNGTSIASVRAMLMTIGQIASYDQIKQLLLESGSFTDTPSTHLIASTAAAGIATTITQPLDVVKTRIMNANQGQYKSIVECVLQTARTGPLSFFKGYTPAFVRLAPHTILTWLFLEQLRLNFGYYK